MSNSKKISRRRAVLLARDPRCYYCGREVRYYHPSPGETLPDDFATIEHVNSRNDGPRPAQGRQVLACYRCNHDKGTEDQRRAQYPGLTYRVGDLFRNLREAV